MASGDFQSHDCSFQPQVNSCQGKEKKKFLFFLKTISFLNIILKCEINDFEGPGLTASILDHTPVMTCTHRKSSLVCFIPRASVLFFKSWP